MSGDAEDVGGPVQRCKDCGTPIGAGYLCDRCDTVEVLDE